MATSSLYIAVCTALSFICFALDCAAVFLPIWGYFEDANGGFGSDRGYFSPWRICKELTYNREKCGSSENVSRFKPSHFVFASGLSIAISSIVLGLYCVLSVVQIAAFSSRESILLRYSTLLSTKLMLAVVGGKTFDKQGGSHSQMTFFFAVVTTLASAGMFAIQTDDHKRGFRVSRGVSFYLVIVSIILTIVLCVLSLYDLMFSRRSGGDPTQVPDVSGSRAITYDNPGYREGEHRKFICIVLENK